MFPDNERMAHDFPDDENGDVLRRMKRNGDDLKISRDINFSVVFPSVGEAQDVVACVRQLGLKTSVEKSGCVPEAPWDVTVTKHMTPTHEDITEFEEVLDDMSNPFGGRNDGWGCISQPIQQ